MNHKSLKDTFVIGFAIFAMFFGAGNLIFPPYLGLIAGKNWFLAFLCFMAVDIGLSLLTLLVVAKIGKGAAGVTGKAWKASVHTDSFPECNLSRTFDCDSENRSNCI